MCANCYPNLLMALGRLSKIPYDWVIGDLDVRAALQAEGSVLLVTRRGRLQRIRITQAAKAYPLQCTALS